MRRRLHCLSRFAVTDMGGQMKITYIHHSSFAVELDGGDKTTVLLFDYFNGELPEWDKDCALYVFASHKHFDHFSKKIFDLATKYPDTTFILAKETRMNEKYMDRWNIPLEARSRINYVHKNEEYDFGSLHVTTLTSTDSGVAFIVECQNKTIYHAGDLNWWAWQDDENAHRMEMAFKNEIDKCDSNFIVDAAFLPLDIRLEGGFYKGFDYYMRRWDIVKAFPMHCWGRFDAIERLLEMDISEGYRERVVRITKDGESWIM